MESVEIIWVDHLPFGQRALWLPEFNRVAIVRGLTVEEREAALDELQVEWRQALEVA